MQEQQKEVKDRGDELNTVLTEMQTISLQFDLLFGTRDTLNARNIEGANWNEQEKSMEEKFAPQNRSNVGREQTNITYRNCP